MLEMRSTELKVRIVDEEECAESIEREGGEMISRAVKERMMLMVTYLPSYCLQRLERYGQMLACLTLK